MIVSCCYCLKEVEILSPEEEEIVREIAAYSDYLFCSDACRDKYESFLMEDNVIS